MADILVLGLLGLILGLAVGYVRREKKKGKKCIGCPYAEQCASAGRNECGNISR